MAVTATAIGRVDVPAQFVGLGSQAPAGAGAIDLSATVVSVAILAADYSSGFAVANVLTAIGATSMVAVAGYVRSSANAAKGFVAYDPSTNKIRGFTSAGTDVTAADGDIFLCICFAL